MTAMAERLRNIAVCVTLAGIGLTTVAASPAAAQGIAGRIAALRVKHWIRLQVVRTVNSDGQTTVTVQRATDAGQFHNLAADQTFVASGPILLTIRRFNPLREAVAVTINDADDPTHATLGKLVESLLATATVLGAKIDAKETRDAAVNNLTASIAGRMRSMGISEVESSCPDARKARGHISVLYEAMNDPLWSPANLRNRIASWTDRIDADLNSGKVTGPQAMNNAATAVSEFIGRPGTAKQTDPPQPAATIEAAIANLRAAIKVIDDAIANESPTPCQRVALETYMVLSLLNPHSRLATFEGIRKSFSAMEASLKAYALGSRWLEPPSDQLDFIAKDTIEPTAAMMKKVKVAFSGVEHQVASPLTAVVVTTKQIASVEMTVAKYVAWVPEIGVGLTFSWVERPKYGTGTDDAGDIVITEGEADRTSIDPTLMMNFVCGFCGISTATPMFQIGTSTSKSTPAIFLGGGVRFLATSKGDFAVGFGFVLPWAKQLKNGVEPGDAIEGTTDLESKLEWRRLPGTYTYLTLQYKF